MVKHVEINYPHNIKNTHNFDEVFNKANQSGEQAVRAAYVSSIAECHRNAVDCVELHNVLSGMCVTLYGYKYLTLGQTYHELEQKLNAYAGAMLNGDSLNYYRNMTK